jgi:hypothetical protein
MGAAALADRCSFFGGLEDEQPGARQLLSYPRQDVGYAQEHRGVAAVAAGVGGRERAAGVVVVHDRRGERHAGLVGYRQRVHVGAQRVHTVARPALAPPTTPCPAMPVRTSSRPRNRKRSATSAAVFTSRLDSSGWACRRRRSATT